MEKEEILDVLQRWDSTGLLTGLPPWEKEELALLYDNVTRVMLSKADSLDEDVYETLGDVTLPTTRRLYRRVGLNFEINTMMDTLAKRVQENYEAINLPPGKDEEGIPHNYVVDFCVEFSDSYSDSMTDKNVLVKEDYENIVGKMLDTIKVVLNNERMVSFVDWTEDEFKVTYSDTKKSPNQTRMWNQKRAIETLHGILNNINQGGF